MKYLADTSALVRIVRRQAAPAWDEAVERGLIAICEPVICEVMTVADAKRYDKAERNLRDTYPWVPVPDDSWQLVSAIRRDLASRSAHQGLSVADYLVAATGMRLKLTVLHEDADFETVGRVVEGFQQQRISQATPT